MSSTWECLPKTIKDEGLKFYRLMICSEIVLFELLGNTFKRVLIVANFKWKWIFWRFGGLVKTGREILNVCVRPDGFWKNRLQVERLWHPPAESYCRNLTFYFRKSIYGICFLNIVIEIKIILKNEVTHFVNFFLTTRKVRFRNFK